MEQMYDTKFHEINSKQWGAGHIRPRNFATNICKIENIPDQKPADPNLYIDDDAYCKGQVVKCILASDSNMHNPPVVTLRRDETERMITVGEAESLMLWPKGVADGMDTPM